MTKILLTLILLLGHEGNMIQQSTYSCWFATAPAVLREKCVGAESMEYAHPTHPPFCGIAPVDVTQTPNAEAFETCETKCRSHGPREKTDIPNHELTLNL